MDKTNDVGSILKTEREQRGLTLEVIQEATKIPIDSLKAIEEGYKIRTLTAFYYKSFVRLYAQHLGLDSLPILAMIPSYQPVSKIVAADKPGALPKPDLRQLNIIAGPASSVNWKKAVPVAAIGLVVVLVAGGLFLAVKGIAGKIAASHQSGQGRSVTAVKLEKAEKVKKSEKSGKAEKSLKAEKSIKTVATEAPVAVTSTTEQDMPAAMPSKDAMKVYLTVRAATTTWLTVRSDGKVVFKGSLKKGSNESWSARKKIEITGKEVNMLEYEVNGKNIGRLSRRDSNARKVVVTPDGLSVEK
ncbi:MAG: RodZ domain-containing protein [Candidatus Omnitrophota bacterium]